MKSLLLLYYYIPVIDLEITVIFGFLLNYN
ncbi:unnamed protein product [Spirodela intermedia]|uniref:Uncharacterized protein n=1 Tax=Spirodela intermedia TaxID=51605 RepID=A0A7I8JGT0_SPIIN|nr:unnamed protein product [Spirodela intermedia]CAA6668743.1 unnamed protein product [Spirodela intermedia]